MQAGPGRRDRPGVELPLRPDVQRIGPKRDRGSQPDDDERDRAHQRRRRDRVPGTESAARQCAQCAGRRIARELEPEGQDREADCNGDRADDDARATHPTPADSAPSINPPTSALVAPGGAAVTCPFATATILAAWPSTSSRSVESTIRPAP